MWKEVVVSKRPITLVAFAALCVALALAAGGCSRVGRVEKGTRLWRTRRSGGGNRAPSRPSESPPKG